MKSTVSAMMMGAFLTVMCGGRAVAAEASEACPYTAAELSAGLGISVGEGKSKETPFRGGKILKCTYRGNGTVWISLWQTKSDSPSVASAMTEGVEGQAIAGDRDQARIAVIGDGTRLSLTYVRNTTFTELSVYGIDAKKESEFKPMRDKLLKLRRVP